MILKNNKNLKEIGEIGVDAGIVWVGDPCYILHRKEEDEPKSIGKDWGEFCMSLDHENGFTSFKYNMGHEGLGICIDTKYGDGVYGVYEVGDRDGIFISFNDEDIQP